MEIKKINETKSALPRTEYLYSVKYDQSTPKRSMLKTKLSGELKSKENLTVIKKIENHYGEKIALVTVFVYKDEKILKEVEFKHVLKKHEKKEEPTEEASAEPAKPEAEEPVEESKEEKSEAQS